MIISIDGFNDYDENDSDIEFRKNRWDYWGILKKVRDEFLAKSKFLDLVNELDSFAAYVEKTYGFKMNIVDGTITDKFDIVDEKLYTYFLLKHG